VTLNLSRLTDQVQAMGEDFVRRAHRQSELIQLARKWLADYAYQGKQLEHVAAAVHAAVPTAEPLNAFYPLPPADERFTIIAADGTQINPDPHGASLYYLINVGSLVYRHGSGERPKAHCEPILGYAEDDIYEDGTLVAGNLLDLRRDITEITRLADLCTNELARSDASDRAHGCLALIDGTMLLWALENRSEQWKRTKIETYIEQLQRIRDTGAAVAAFISRPRHTEVARLLHLASVGGDPNAVSNQPNPLGHLSDRMILGILPPGTRSALFVSSKPINRTYYDPAGHSVHFFYLNLATKSSEPVIARVEIPAWVARNPNLLNLTHAAIVAQALITGDYPYALARADELAYIDGHERAALNDMIAAAFLRAGVRSAISPKAFCKTLTRQTRRKH